MANVLSTINGVASATSKTFNGLVRASMKNIIGLDCAIGISMQDDFSTGPENPISTPWVSGPGAFNDMAQTSGGKAEGTGSNSGASINSASYAFSGNHGAEVQLDSINSNGPSVRGQSGSSACYVAKAYSSTRIILQKFDSSASATDILDINPLPGSYVMGANEFVALEISGTTLTVKVGTSHPATTTVGTATDATLSGGQPGMFSNGYAAFLDFWGYDL